MELIFRFMQFIVAEQEYTNGVTEASLFCQQAGACVPGAGQGSYDDHDENRLYLKYVPQFAERLANKRVLTELFEGLDNYSVAAVVKRRQPRRMRGAWLDEQVAPVVVTEAQLATAAKACLPYRFSIQQIPAEVRRLVQDGTPNYNLGLFMTDFNGINRRSLAINDLVELNPEQFPHALHRTAAVSSMIINITERRRDRLPIK